MSPSAYALLLRAVQQGDPEMLRAAVARGAAVDLRDAHGTTALMHACMLGGSGAGDGGAVVRCLLELKASPDGANAAGTTALHCAVSTGNAAAVEALLSCGAPVDAADGGRVRALMSASLAGHAELVTRLLRAKADPSAADLDGGTALMRASARGHLLTVQALLEAGADTHATSLDDGATALHSAAAEGHTAVVAALLRAGTRPDTRDADGMTPLQLAEEQSTCAGLLRVAEAAAVTGASGTGAAAAARAAGAAAAAAGAAWSAGSAGAAGAGAAAAAAGALRSARQQSVAGGCEDGSPPWVILGTDGGVLKTTLRAGDARRGFPPPGAVVSVRYRGWIAASGAVKAEAEAGGVGAAGGGAGALGTGVESVGGSSAEPLAGDGTSAVAERGAPAIDESPHPHAEVRLVGTAEMEFVEATDLASGRDKSAERDRVLASGQPPPPPPNAAASTAPPATSSSAYAASQPMSLPTSPPWTAEPFLDTMPSGLHLAVGSMTHGELARVLLRPPHHLLPPPVSGMASRLRPPVSLLWRLPVGSSKQYMVELIGWRPPAGIQTAPTIGSRRPPTGIGAAPGMDSRAPGKVWLPGAIPYPCIREAVANARSLKEEGNTALGRGDWRAALDAYSRAVEVLSGAWVRQSTGKAVGGVETGAAGAAAQVAEVSATASNGEGVAERKAAGEWEMAAGIGSATAGTVARAEEAEAGAAPPSPPESTALLTACLVNAAQCHLKLNRPADAEECCTRALGVSPTSAKAFYRRAIARRHMGHPILAVKDAAAAVRLEPRSADARALHAECQGEAEAARREERERARRMVAGAQGVGEGEPRGGSGEGTGGGGAGGDGGGPGAGDGAAPRPPLSPLVTPAEAALSYENEERMTLAKADALEGNLIQDIKTGRVDCLSDAQLGGRAARYSWAQNEHEVSIRVPGLPRSTQGGDLRVHTTSDFISVRYRGEPLVEGRLHRRILSDETIFTLDEEGAGSRGRERPAARQQGWAVSGAVPGLRDAGAVGADLPYSSRPRRPAPTAASSAQPCCVLTVTLTKLEPTRGDRHWRCAVQGEAEIEPSIFGPPVLGFHENNPADVAEYFRLQQLLASKDAARKLREANSWLDFGPGK